MSKFQNLKVKTKGFFKAHGSDIGCYGGCVAIGVGVILACKATLKVNEKAKEDSAKVEEIKKQFKLDIKAGKKLKKGEKHANSNDSELIQLHKEGNKQLTKHYVSSIGRYCLYYTPAALLIAGGMAANIAAHRSEKKGRLEMTGIAAGLAASLKKYRDKFKEEHGEEAEKEFFYNVKKQEKEVVDDKGKAKKVEEKVLPKDIDISDFAKFFGVDYSDAATGYPEADLVFLKNVERSATRKLAEDKWLTLNELYKMLALRDAAGQRYGIKGGNNIGWVYDKDHPEQNIVDLGLFSLQKTGNQDYVNGFNDVILIEPNVNCLDLGNAMWGLDMKTPDPDLFRG